MNESQEDFGLAYLDSCDRVPLLLIHGFPFNSSMWEPQVEDVGDVARVIAPDLRGFGRSDAPPAPYNVGMFAEDCANLLLHLGIEGPVIVGGLSMGGYVALEFYRRYPERVAGLVLASTRAGADSAEGRVGRDKAAETARSQGAKAIADSMLPKLLAPQNYEDQPDVVEFLQEMMESASVEGIVGALNAMRDRPDSTSMLREIDVPTLVIHGADDKLIPVAEAEALFNAIPNAELVIIDNAGHVPNLENPDDFNDALLDFVETFYEE